MPDKIRLLIIDDHTVVRHGLRLMLEQKPDFEVVGEGQDGFEAVALADQLKPDVILMDLLMPRLNGLEAITRIHQQQPEIALLVLTSYSDEDNLIAAIKAGAAGYLLKDSSPADLVAAIVAVYEGNFTFNPEFTRRLMAELRHPTKKIEPLDVLSGREMDVLRMAGAGLSNAEIAARLFITEGTVRFHLSNILHKLNLPSRTQAVLYAIREGLANLNNAP
jgi:NarL family two-component system response regulator LiaR